MKPTDPAGRGTEEANARPVLADEQEVTCPRVCSCRYKGTLSSVMSKVDMDWLWDFSGRKPFWIGGCQSLLLSTEHQEVLIHFKCSLSNRPKRQGGPRALGVGRRGAARLHQLEEDATPAEDQGPQEVRAGVEAGQVAEQRLQVGARPRLRVLAEAAVLRGQTVTPETRG